MLEQGVPTTLCFPSGSLICSVNRGTTGRLEGKQEGEGTWSFLFACSCPCHPSSDSLTSQWQLAPVSIFKKKPLQTRLAAFFHTPEVLVPGEHLFLRGLGFSSRGAAFQVLTTQTSSFDSPTQGAIAASLLAVIFCVASMTPL